MKLLLILNRHKKKLYQIETAEEIDELIEELRNIDESELREIKPDVLREINSVITEIFKEVEKRKTEIIESIEKSEKNIKGIKAYSR
ncbi:MAG: hypothetical protein Q9M89_01030 [Persephonella sp.]|nr:hypothetical protein [Persephonella sp.]